MSATQPQSFKNHLRFVPLFHFVLAFLLVVYLAASIWNLVRDFSPDNCLGVLLAVALVLLFYYARGFPLAVQDRLIRLEMRLRLAEVLPDELAGRIGEITEDQLIGLRFASDAEMAQRVTEVLEGKLVSRTQIKKAIETWVPDDYRC